MKEFLRIRHNNYQTKVLKDIGCRIPGAGFFIGRYASKAGLRKAMHLFILGGVVISTAFFFVQEVGASVSDDINKGPLFIAKTYGEFPIAICHRKIEEAGIPIDGVSGWPVKRIDFKPEATEEQKAKAWEIVNNFDLEKELEKLTPKSLITTHGSKVPILTTDGQIAIAQVNGSPYIYFRADGVTQHILGASSFEISPAERKDAISGEQMEIGDFVIGMIDKNLKNGDTDEESSLHGVWVKWSSVKKQLIEELKTSGAFSLEGGFAESANNGGTVLSLVDKIKSEIASFGIGIKSGVTQIFNLATETFFAKRARVEKLEFVDKLTGDIYCTWVENGEWHKEKGDCESIANGNAIKAPIEKVEVTPTDALAEVETEAETQEPVSESPEEVEVAPTNSSAEVEIEEIPVSTPEPEPPSEPASEIPAPEEAPIPEEPVLEEPLVQESQ